MVAANGGAVGFAYGHAQDQQLCAATPIRLPRCSELGTPPSLQAASMQHSSQDEETQGAQEQMSPVDLKGGDGYTFRLRVSSSLESRVQAASMEYRVPT